MPRSTPSATRPDASFIQISVSRKGHDRGRGSRRGDVGTGHDSGAARSRGTSSSSHTPSEDGGALDRILQQRRNVVVCGFAADRRPMKKPGRSAYNPYAGSLVPPLFYSACLTSGVVTPYEFQTDFCSGDTESLAKLRLFFDLPRSRYPPPPPIPPTFAI